MIAGRGIPRSNGDIQRRWPYAQALIPGAIVMAPVSIVVVVIILITQLQGPGTVGGQSLADDGTDPYAAVSRSRDGYEPVIETIRVVPAGINVALPGATTAAGLHATRGVDQYLVAGSKLHCSIALR